MCPFDYQLLVSLEPAFQFCFQLSEVYLHKASATKIRHRIDMTVQLLQTIEFLFDCFYGWAAFQESGSIHEQVLLVGDQIGKQVLQWLQKVLQFGREVAQSLFVPFVLKRDLRQEGFIGLSESILRSRDLLRHLDQLI